MLIGTCTKWKTEMCDEQKRKCQEDDSLIGENYKFYILCHYLKNVSISHVIEVTVLIILSAVYLEKFPWSNWEII